MSRKIDDQWEGSLQSILEARKARKRPAKGKARAKDAQPAKGTAELAATTEKRGPGRPPAKRSSDDYRQITTYVRKDLYRKTQNVLDDENDGRPKGTVQKTFADALDEALTEWLSRNGVEL